MPGPGKNPATEATFKIPPRRRCIMPGRNNPGQLCQRRDVDLKHFQLPRQRQPGELAPGAEAGVVHQNIHRDSPALQFLEDAFRGFGQGKIGGQNERLNLVRRRNSSASDCNASVLRAVSTRRDPSAAKHFASSRPMPDEAPVTKTVSLFAPLIWPGSY